MKHIFVFLIVVIPFFAISQECDCESNFHWMKKVFEENDAGFLYVIEIKGKQTYEQHNEIYQEKVKSITDHNDCNQTLFQWLTFFRPSHIGMRSLKQQQSSPNDSGPTDDEIRQQFKDWEKSTINMAQFENEIKSKKEVDYEGIWASGPYKIGIKKKDSGYIGFVIEADGIYWTPHQIKLKIHSDKSATYYMRDHSPREFENTELLGNNYLQMGFITLERVHPVFENDPAVDRYFKSISAEKSYLDKINDQTLLLRIPTFDGSQKWEIDSLIAQYRDEILQSPNLVIDLRNNGGGSDRCYYKLLPLLYTNPIRTVGVELYSTPLNNQRMLDFINDPKFGFDEDEKKWAQESYEKLTKRIGEFVNLDSSDVDITTYDTIHPYPKNVGIIINENNGSTAEQFLLAAKQSKKVKLFGTTTFGVLDISNMHFVKSPCEDFELGYCLSKSLRIPDMTIDNKGIQPDYYITRDIAKYKWIDFVVDILNE